MLSLLNTLFLALWVSSASADSLAEVEHIVLFMQENRAFDHYFGTMAGVRGFKDPNVQVNPDGHSVFFQKVNSFLSNDTDFLLPFYVAAEGGEFINGTQCMVAGTNNWAENHAALASGQNDLWPEANTPESWGYYRRSDLQVQFAIAEGWTVGDMYQEGVIAATNPNRVLWQTGSVAVPGGNVNTTQGPVLDNNASPGCTSLTQRLENGTEIESAQNYTCYPFDWKTLPEYLEDAGISWKEFQAYDIDDNPLPDFVFWQNLAANDPTSELAQRGLAMNGGGNWQGGLDLLKKQAAEGTLPAVSFYIGPGELSEHPPARPIDGAWLQKEVVDAIVNSPKYNKTILMISFDESGGFGDHVIPFTSPENTPGEWIINPFTGLPAPSGPGFRLPFTVISPWTRGGVVFTEPADHISQTLFLEQWAAARGTPFINTQINDWRREHMSNLINVFDFENPNYTAVSLPDVPPPHTDPLTSLLDGYTFCENTFTGYVQPPVPYGQQTLTDSLFTETGFKIVRGSLTEGRYLVIESSTKNLALSANDSSLGTSAATNDKFTTPSQRFVIYATDPKLATEKTFRISSAASVIDATAIANATTPFLDANLQFGSINSSAVFNITYEGLGVYNFLESESGKFLGLGDNGAPMLGGEAEGFKIFSISF
ncbi:phosphoesterase family-domain-containing protein [Lentinula edodes]|uniref:phosphoesterase family-domain-containing protein n=1 Tax=Lentinula edodes TaxID=5353 RepID=UPI001E8E6672|nr:phosphoesterase family-domain-containing protein [Lentinula edodes]KAH7874242.1 phosphoesterase family-domain-containing protein [Lentinula edodes]